jgi:hypothetical protein
MWTNEQATVDLCVFSLMDLGDWVGHGAVACGRPAVAGGDDGGQGE